MLVDVWPTPAVSRGGTKAEPGRIADLAVAGEVAGIQAAEEVAKGATRGERAVVNPRK
jgi:hypothetical protein